MHEFKCGRVEKIDEEVMPETESKVMTEMPWLHIQAKLSEATREKQTEGYSEARQRRKKMRITKTSKVWIFVLAAHHTVATSYFVHVFR